jgi:hypothetical protein
MKPVRNKIAAAAAAEAAEAASAAAEETTGTEEIPGKSFLKSSIACMGNHAGFFLFYLINPF